MGGANLSEPVDTGGEGRLLAPSGHDGFPPKGRGAAEPAVSGRM